MTQYKNLIIPQPFLDPNIQAGLTLIGGKNPFGEPILLLEWGGDALKWPNGPAKYWTKKDRDGYHCDARWFVSQWQSFEQVCPQGREWWENNRHSNLAEAHNDGVPLGTDLLGPPPLRGQYRAELALPYGYKPDETLLDYFRYLKAQRDAAPDQSAMSEAARAANIQAGIRADEDAEAAERKARREEFRESFKSDLEPMKPRLARTAARQTRGYHRNFSRGENYDPNHWPLESKPIESKITIPSDKDIKKYG